MLFPLSRRFSIQFSLHFALVSRHPREAPQFTRSKLRAHNQGSSFFRRTSDSNGCSYIYEYHSPDYYHYGYSSNYYEGLTASYSVESSKINGHQRRSSFSPSPFVKAPGYSAPSYVLSPATKSSYYIPDFTSIESPYRYRYQAVCIPCSKWFQEKAEDGYFEDGPVHLLVHRYLCDFTKNFWGSSLRVGRRDRHSSFRSKDEGSNTESSHAIDDLVGLPSTLEELVIPLPDRFGNRRIETWKDGHGRKKNWRSSPYVIIRTERRQKASGPLESTNERSLPFSKLAESLLPRKTSLTISPRTCSTQSKNCWNEKRVMFPGVSDLS